MDNLQAIKILLVEEAAFWDAQLNEVRLNALADALAMYPAHRVKDAMVVLRAEKGRRTMPLPADLAIVIDGEVSPEARATMAIGRVQEAITRFGYMRGAEAREFIGSLGWEAVKANGGWQRVCEDHGLKLEPGVFFAQAVKLVKASAEYSSAGRRDEAPSLPEPKSKPVLTAAADVIKRILPARGAK